MQIYSKSMKNATSPLFRNHNRSALEAGTYITHRVIYYPLVLLVINKLRYIWYVPCMLAPDLALLNYQKSISF